MIQAWRLCRKTSKRKAFDGAGARRYGGRWTPEGLNVVYTAESRALAALEILVHADPADLPHDLVCFGVEIPARVKLERIELEHLPRGWRRYPAPPALQQLGQAWLEAGKTAVLQVPSAVVPAEHNYLLNPAHADFAKLHIGRAEPFALDPRLAGR